MTKPNPQELRTQLMSLYKNMRVMAFLVLPLARVSQESLSAVYARTFEKAAFGFAKMYVFCLFMRVLLSWFPGIDWNAQPWTFLRLLRVWVCVFLGAGEVLGRGVCVKRGGPGIDWNAQFWTFLRLLLEGFWWREGGGGGGSGGAALTSAFIHPAHVQRGARTAGRAETVTLAP